METLMRSRTLVAFSILGILVLGLQGCESTPSAPVSSPETVIDPSCYQSFSRTIAPLRLSGGRHFYFDPAELSFLEDPAYELSSVSLNATLRGRYHGTAFEVPLAINGLQAVPADGRTFFELLRYHSGENRSEVRHHLHQLAVNGGISLRGFMLKAKQQKGEIKLSLQGEALFALSGAMEISGTYSGDCPLPKPSSSPTPPAPSPTPTVTVAPTAPITRLVSVTPDSALTASRTISFTFASDQLGVVFHCSLDGAAEEPCASPWSYADLSNGPHLFRVIAENSAGLRDPSGASHEWIIDAIAPDASITNASALPALSAGDAIEFQFAANDPAAIFECTLDDGPALPCASPQSYSQLAEGSHRFSVLATDSLGNRGTPAEFQWAIDLTPPQAYVVQATPAEAITAAQSMSLQFAATESATFECSLDHGAFETCASPTTYSALPQGLHRIEVRATDLAGNKGVAATYSWAVDLTPPSILLGNVLPANGSLSNAAMLSVEFSTDELAQMFCAWDGAAASACSSPFLAPVLSDGNHELKLQAMDSAGNLSEALTLAWIIDSQAPTLSFGTILPSAGSFINVDWLQATVIADESVQLSCSLDATDLGSMISPIPLVNLAEGQHLLRVNGTDSAGNTAAPITHAFVVDLTAPSVELSSGVATITNETSNTFTFTANEEASFECNLNGIGFTACTSPIQISGFADGLQLFEVRATDRAGNTGNTAAVYWTVDLAPPQVNLTVTRATNAEIRFDFTASEAGSSFECSLDGAAFAPCASPLSYSGLAVGDHNFIVRAQDALGNQDPVGASHAWTVEPAATTKITVVNPSAPFTNQRSVSFQFTTNVGVKFLCSLDGGTANECASGVSYSSLAEGQHLFLVRAVDRWGVPDAVGATHSWIVDTTPPAILSITHSYTRSSVTINWTTSEPALSQVNWGVGIDTSRVFAGNGAYSTSHTVTLTGLSSNTQYSYIVGGKDQAGNAYQGTRRSFRTNP